MLLSEGHNRVVPGLPGIVGPQNAPARKSRPAASTRNVFVKRILSPLSICLDNLEFIVKDYSIMIIE
jgi:hypothetical protein